mmetsp:Transcript_17395/g.37578  ORF Transcript_17395/g.37578 Transcript_17395/m.37578 type:complete len:100 (+) Transcript_17395:59-358(+)
MGIKILIGFRPTSLHFFANIFYNFQTKLQTIQVKLTHGKQEIVTSSHCRNYIDGITHPPEVCQTELKSNPPDRVLRWHATHRKKQVHPDRNNHVVNGKP